MKPRKTLSETREPGQACAGREEPSQGRRRRDFSSLCRKAMGALRLLLIESGPLLRRPPSRVTPFVRHPIHMRSHPTVHLPSRTDLLLILYHHQLNSLPYLPPEAIHPLYPHSFPSERHSTTRTTSSFTLPSPRRRRLSFMSLVCNTPLSHSYCHLFHLARHTPQAVPLRELLGTHAATSARRLPRTIAGWGHERLCRDEPAQIGRASCRERVS